MKSYIVFLIILHMSSTPKINGDTARIDSVRCSAWLEISDKQCKYWTKHRSGLCLQHRMDINKYHKFTAYCQPVCCDLR